MRIVMTSLAVLALMACNKPAETTTENVAEENMAMDANAMDANAMATPAGFQINDTTWEFTQEGEARTLSADASGNYVTWAGAKHIDHGTVAMKDDKVCFTSAMNQDGAMCWTTQPTEVGQSFESTNDKGEKLTVKRVAFMAVPDNVKP